jgi:hypothetical protein
MVVSYATGIGALLMVLIGWVAVQNAWRRAFPGASDPDALAERTGCQRTRCADACDRSSADCGPEGHGSLEG